MTEKKATEDLLLRMGDVQILTHWEGSGPGAKLKARINRVIPEEVLKVNPDAGKVWTMEELAALGQLCEKACESAIRRQTIDIAASRAAMAKAVPTTPSKPTATKKTAAKKTRKKRAATKKKNARKRR